MSEPVEVPRGEISLLALAAFFWRNKLIIGLCTLLFAAAAAGASFMLTPKYRAEVVFSPVSSSGSFTDSLGGSIGGLAALAGLSLGGGGKRADESLEYLRSREFTRGFIERHALMPVLYANRWDAKSRHWRGDDPPTISDGVERFSHKVTQVTEDHRTGMVTLAIVWRDRVVAAQWANEMVAEADAALRARAIAEFNRSLDYLKEAARDSTIVEVQAAVAKTMESELKDSMMARTRDAYAFKVIDPAVVRDAKDIDSPNRPLIIALGAGFGLVIGTIWASRREQRSRSRLR